MSQRRRRPGPALSVAEAMDRVRWDYTPGARPLRGRSVGDFFDDFPWDGATDDAAEDDEADTDE